MFNLRLPSLELNWVIEADAATCFGIYLYKDSYIVHGELGISRITREGKIQWENSARDIFVNIEHYGNTFQMHDGYIELMDWGGFRYKLSYDGHITDDGMAPRLKSGIVSQSSHMCGHGLPLIFSFLVHIRIRNFERRPFSPDLDDIRRPCGYNAHLARQ